MHDDTTVRLIRRADGNLGIHDYHTGALLGVLPPWSEKPQPLDEQMRAADIAKQRTRRQRRESAVAYAWFFVALAGCVALGVAGYRLVLALH